MIYVACPYSHPDPAIRQARFEAVTEYTAQLYREGKIAFSPITHSHPLVAHGAPTDWESWREFDRQIVAICEELHVLMLYGWRESVGIRDEHELFASRGISAVFVPVARLEYRHDVA